MKVGVWVRAMVMVRVVENASAACEHGATTEVGAAEE